MIRLNGSVIERAKSRLLLIVIVGSISLVILFFLSLCIGEYPMSFDSAISSFFHLIANGGNTENNISYNVIWSLRLPRTLAVIAVGIGLSIAGASMQAIIRNPLVDPYITGVSSGASLGAMLAILAGFSIVQASFFTVPIAAFVGALMAFAFTMALSEASGGKPIDRGCRGHRSDGIMRSTAR